MRQRKPILPVFAGWALALEAWGFPVPAAESPRKEASVFYPTRLIETGLTQGPLEAVYK